MTSRTWPVSFLVLAACGSHAPPGPDRPSLASDPPPAAGSDPAVEPVGSGSDLPPALVAALASRPLIIEPLTSLRLSAAERLRAQQVIGQWATREGLTILPPETVEQAVSRAAAGLDPTTNRACGPALDREYALERWVVAPMAAEGHIAARVDCRHDCTLSVSFELFGNGTEFYAAPFDPGQPWEAELKRRLPELTDVGGHERYGHANNPTPLAGIHRTEGAHDWYYDETEQRSDLGAAEIAKCGLTDRTVVLLLDRTPAGRLTCEAAAIPGYITEYDARVNACACAVAVANEKPTAARSYLSYVPQPDPARPTTANGKSISAMLIGGDQYRPEGSAAWFLRESDRLDACLVGRTEAVKADEASALLDFDANGAVAKATLIDPQNLFRADERTCIVKKLKAIRTPCPPTPRLSGEVRVTLEISDR